MANIGYIQVVRHCNHVCGFCSNPPSPYEHSFQSIKVLIDDFIKRKYYGVVLTGGEPSLHSNLPAICKYASDNGLHVRMISNGHKLADATLVKDMKNAGLQIAHISIYSIFPSIEEQIRGVKNTLDKAYKAIENLIANNIEVNINCVINKLNANHLHQNIDFFIKTYPQIKHFVWNNLDTSLGRAEINQKEFTAKLSEFESSLYQAMSLAHKHNKTFRVERVPLCYMSKFAWASTETRKIIKDEERIVHFLDEKQTIRQTNWKHLYSEKCNVCSLKFICGGLFDRGDFYDVNELHPIFINYEDIVKQVIYDPMDPSYNMDFEKWKIKFEQDIILQSHVKPKNHDIEKLDIKVGSITSKSLSLFQKIKNK